MLGTYVNRGTVDTRAHVYLMCVDLTYVSWTYIGVRLYQPSTYFRPIWSQGCMFEVCVYVVSVSSSRIRLTGLKSQLQACVGTE